MTDDQFDLLCEAVAECQHDLDKPRHSIRFWKDGASCRICQRIWLVMNVSSLIADADSQL